jgi:hypothetical protein
MQVNKARNAFALAAPGQILLAYLRQPQRQGYILMEWGLSVRSCRVAINWPVSQKFNDLFVSSTG